MMKSHHVIASAFIVALGTQFASSSPANAILLTTLDGTVETVDVSTGAVTPYSNSSGIQFFDIALSNTGSLYGISNDNNLYSIAPNPGSSQLIGPAVNVPTGRYIDSLSFDGNNNLFGTGGTGIYSINIGTGEATLIANIANFFSAGDIIFNPATNTFFAASRTPNNSTLFEIASNGSARQIGNIGFPNVLGLAFEGKKLYGYTSAAQQLLIDQSTGAGTFSVIVGGGSTSILGAASSINQAPTTSVPEPFTIIGTLIGGTAALRMRKKLKPAIK